MVLGRGGSDPLFKMTWDDISLGEELGTGTFGKAFLGHLKRDTKHARKGEKIAIKVLQATDRDALEFFKAEVNVLKDLQNKMGTHPHVLVLHGANLTQEPYFLVTEFLDAGCLYDYIRAKRKQGGIPIARVMRWALELAKGLRHLHYGHLTHRDLKSPNIMIVRGKGDGDDKLHLKLIDFGLAKTINKGDIHTVKVGSYRWMAPEVINASLEVRDAYTNKVDTYSYGMVLYELVSGLLPFTKLTPMQVSMAVVKSFRPEIPARCPPALELLIRQCWDSDPNERPTFDQVVTDLGKLLNDHVHKEDLNASRMEAEGGDWMHPMAGLRRNIDIGGDVDRRRSDDGEVRLQHAAGGSPVSHMHVGLNDVRVSGLSRNSTPGPVSPTPSVVTQRPKSMDGGGICIVKTGSGHQKKEQPSDPAYVAGVSSPGSSEQDAGGGAASAAKSGYKVSFETKVKLEPTGDESDDEDVAGKKRSLDFYRHRQGPGRGDSVSQDLNLMDTKFPTFPSPPPPGKVPVEQPKVIRGGGENGGGAQGPAALRPPPPPQGSCRCCIM